MGRRRKILPGKTDEKTSLTIPNIGLAQDASIDTLLMPSEEMEQDIAAEIEDIEIEAAAEAILAEQKKLVGKLREKVAKTEAELSRLKSLLAKLTGGATPPMQVLRDEDPASTPVAQNARPARPVQSGGLRGFHAGGPRSKGDMEIMRLVERIGG